MRLRCIHFHPLSSAFIHFHPLSSAFIRFHPLSSTFIHFHPFSSTFIHFHPLSSTFIHFHPFSSTFIHFRPLSPTFIHFHPAVQNRSSSNEIMVKYTTWQQTKIHVKLIFLWNYSPPNMFKHVQGAGHRDRPFYCCCWTFPLGVIHKLRNHFWGSPLTLCPM